MDLIECVVVGAGVVGLAVARALAQSGYETLIVDRDEGFGTETSSRNSEVIHAGIYYPAGSLKAELCVRGRHLLYEFCDARGLPYRRCGKLIVATHPDQNAALAGIAAAADANGVEGMQMLSRAQAVQLEPALRCTEALLSPSTGIIDSHAYMLSLLGEAENAGATFAALSEVEHLRIAQSGVELFVAGDCDPLLQARWMINCAGLNAPGLARRIEGFPAQSVPKAYYAKGSYFTLSGRAPFSRLIYPVPEPGGLGVHLTIDLAGQARFGPDVEWVQDLDYTVDLRRADGFYEVIRRYWPQLQDGQLAPGYSGIRPKISGPGEPAADFRIDGPDRHGIAGIINLFGIESPGLTASLAIAERVSAIVSRA